MKPVIIEHLLCAKKLARSLYTLCHVTLTKAYKVHTLFIPILQMRTLKAGDLIICPWLRSWETGPLEFKPRQAHVLNHNSCVFSCRHFRESVFPEILKTQGNSKCV